MQTKVTHKKEDSSHSGYNTAMGRKLTRPRPKQGEHLAQLRKKAGLSQYQLANQLSVPQTSIAFWETSEKPPRSEVLPQLAEALGVTVAELLNTQDKVIVRKSGPTGKLQKMFEQASELPRNQQDKLVDFISLFIQQYHQSKQVTVD